MRINIDQRLFSIEAGPPGNDGVYSFLQTDTAVAILIGLAPAMLEAEIEQPCIFI
jgi:hypothetical protein